MPVTRTPEQEIDFCHDALRTWQQFARAMSQAEKYEGSSREEPARMEAAKAKRKLFALGQWPGSTAGR